MFWSFYLLFIKILEKQLKASSVSLYVLLLISCYVLIYWKQCAQHQKKIKEKANNSPTFSLKIVHTEKACIDFLCQPHLEDKVYMTVWVTAISNIFLNHLSWCGASHFFSTFPFKSLLILSPRLKKLVDARKHTGGRHGALRHYV